MVKNQEYSNIGKYDRLIRDKIPEITMKSEGKTIITKILAAEDKFIFYLFKKVKEEAEELIESQDRGCDDTKKELADLFELLDTIIEVKGFNRNDIVNIQMEKREKSGGFKKRLLMIGKT